MNTNNWKLDLFSALDAAHSIKTIMGASLDAVRPFGFDFCGWRTSPPLEKEYNDTNGIAFNAVEDKALEKIVKGDCDAGPIPRHCALSPDPIAWRGTTEDDIFLRSPTLWEEYYGTGHRSGWAISTVAPEGERGIFFVESKNILTSQEMWQAEQHMQWVSAAAYIRLQEIKDISSGFNISQLEINILKRLYHYNASIKKMVELDGVDAGRVIRVIKQLQQTFGCNSLHSLIAHALFMGIID